MARNLTAKAALPKMLIMLLVSGCESTDRRLADMAQQATAQQTRQNDRMAQQSEAIVKQSQEVAAAANQLVAQDAAARRELWQAHAQLQQQHQTERSSLDRQREQLEGERKAAAQAAIRDPVVAQAIVSAGLFLAALLPLLVALYAIQRLPEQRPTSEWLDQDLLEGLIDHSMGHSRDESGQCPGPAAAPRLGGPEGSRADN